MMQSNAERSGPTAATSSSQVAALMEPEVSEKSAPGGTLGLATITMPLPVRSRGMTLAIVGAAAGLAVGVAGMLLVRSGGTAGKEAQGTAAAMHVEPVANGGDASPIVGAADSAAASSSPPVPLAVPVGSAATAASAAVSDSSPTSLPSPSPRPRYVPRPRPKPRVNDGF
jgi:hypothetical protein